MRTVFVTFALALGAAGPAAAGEAAPEAGAPAAAESVIAPLASRSLLLDVAVVPHHTEAATLVAVGERGHVLLSQDAGREWRQVRVPTRANLTAVSFANERRGCAVGHDQVILCTQDGGATWDRRHFAPEAEAPLLDVAFLDESNALAVGAFSAVFRTTDGGATWQEATFAPTPLVAAEKKGPATAREEMLADEELSEPHLNAIVPAGGGRVYIAAEAGALYRSDDAGATWLQLPSPYEGSFFGVLPLDGESLLAFGLRGHLFRSDDAGRTWQKLDSGTESLLAGGARLPDGAIAIAGLAGVVIVSRDGGRTFAVHQEADRKGFSAVVPGADGLVLVGETGVRRLGADVIGAGKTAAVAAGGRQ